MNYHGGWFARSGRNLRRPDGFTDDVDTGRGDIGLRNTVEAIMLKAIRLPTNRGELASLAAGTGCAKAGNRLKLIMRVSY